MKIEILGPGCARCEAVAQNASQAAKELGLDVQIEKITDMAAIVGYGVMSTPGIAIDGHLKGSGRLFSVEEIKEMLRNA